MLDPQLGSFLRRTPARALRFATLGLIALAVLPAAASASHNDNYFASQSINQPGQLLSSFTTSHTSLGAAAGTNPGAADKCGSVWFGADVWYDFHPHRNGRIRITVIGPAGSNYEPVVGVFKYNLTTGLLLPFEPATCQASTPGINRAVFPAEGDHGVSAGVHYKIQLGGANKPNASQAEGGVPWTGNYQLNFTYDPDTDGDSLLDSQDRCDNERGSAVLQGCPDGDGDGLADVDDRCVGQRGPRDLRGCPDSDTDGRPDIDDRCPFYDSSDRDPNRDGCLDLHLLVDSKIVPRGTYRGGIIIRSLRILKVPRGSRVSITCRRSHGRRNCGSTLIRKATTASVRATIARTVRIRKLERKRLPFGSKITIRVTKPGATGWYRRYTVLRSAKVFKLTDRCSNVGSSKLRKRGCK